ncbi:MAG: flagellar basal body P-ring protein FlgI [Opitutales bacterium]|nr:flagellar basal body P-ring protein FlgI [Opitutales bacterium]
MKFNLSIALTLLALCLPFSLSASRIKDITVVEGGRDNQLVGYGLVVGLAGSGDSQLNFTIQSIANSLQRFGIQVPADSVKSDNVAAVMVTADIGPFMKPGVRLDITVSSIGDADTIQGGVLLQTPLIGADGVVYAVAQGPVTVGGFFAGQGGAGGATVQKNHPTVGSITGGAIVEREITTQIVSNGEINLLLLNPDYTSAVRVADAINTMFPACAGALDSNNVNVRIPPLFDGQVPNFIAALGQLEVIPDISARVIINERTGTIVATQNVRLSKIAVSHGSLVISIASDLEASQPNALSDTGETVVTPSTQTDVTEIAGGFDVVDDFPTIERLTSALNAMGVSTRDMISILQTMKSAGALQAELIVN